MASLDTVLHSVDERVRAGQRAVARSWATGFDPLDSYVGGLRAGELIILGGAQGLGKTTLALQMARNIVAAGSSVLYVTFEHDQETVLQRLIALEAAEVAGDDAVRLRSLQQAMSVTAPNEAGLAGRLVEGLGGAEALDRIAEYGSRLYVESANGRTTTVDRIAELAGHLSQTQSTVVVVDYLQKIPDRDGSDLEQERVTRIVQGLKDLALAHQLPVLAISASDKEGIAPGLRLRSHHLRGTSAVAYEADVILIMNDKYDVVARDHIVYNQSNAERFHEWIVLTIEKNRSGLDRVDMEFRKRLDQARFERTGGLVKERLANERIMA